MPKRKRPARFTCVDFVSYEETGCKKIPGKSVSTSANVETIQSPANFYLHAKRGCLSTRDVSRVRGQGRGSGQLQGQGRGRGRGLGRGRKRFIFTI